MKLEELNRAYVDLIKRFKALQKEKGELQICMEELLHANKMLEGDFNMLFRQLSHYKDNKKRLSGKICERLAAQESLIDGIDSVLDYIVSLFEEG